MSHIKRRGHTNVMVNFKWLIIRKETVATFFKVKSLQPTLRAPKPGTPQVSTGVQNPFVECYPLPPVSLRIWLLRDHNRLWRKNSLCSSLGNSLTPKQSELVATGQREYKHTHEI